MSDPSFELEITRRWITLLEPGEPSGLDRERALAILQDLVTIKTERDQLVAKVVQLESSRTETL